MGRNLLTCCVVLTYAFLATGCGQVRDLTGQDPGGQYEIGIGQISGKLVVNAPLVNVMLTSPDQPEPDGQALLQLKGDFALFRPNTTFYTRSLQQPGPLRQVIEIPGIPAVMPGRCELPFTFEAVPVNRYEMGFYWAEYGDWESEGILHFIHSMPVNVTNTQPIVDGIEFVEDQFGAIEHGATVRGKYLLSGNQTNFGLGFSLYQEKEQPVVNPFGASSPSWIADLAPTQYGRVFFEMKGVKPGKYDTSWSVAPGQWRGYYWPLTDDLARPATLTIDVAADQVLENLIGYSCVETYPDWSPNQSPDYVPRYKGILQVELHISHEIDWSKDTLLLAESVPFDAHPNFSNWAYISESYYESTDTAVFRLFALHDGQYRLSLIQLGETNADTPIVLAEREELIDLANPFIDVTSEDDYAYLYPYAEIVWEPDLS